jgi:V8-like Glu-specific endopeptidase
MDIAPRRLIFPQVSVIAFLLVGHVTPQLGAQLRPVANSSAAPYSDICRLVAIRQEGSKRKSYSSTGFLLGSGYLLTAAHNVAIHDEDPVVDGSVRCGQAGARAVWDAPGTLRQSTIAYPSEWEDFTDDYAAVALGGAPSRPSSFRLPQGREAYPRRGTVVHVAGYRFGGTALYHATGIVQPSSDSTAILHTARTTTGMSGGPVWIETAAGERVVVGVHDGAITSGPNRGLISARRLDANAIRRIQAWIAAWEAVTR